MKSLFETFTRYSIFRMAILFAMGAVTFFFPEFLLRGMAYVIAGYADTSIKPILIILAVFIMIGGIVANIFTFGFGGVLTLSQIFGTLLLFSCVYELIVFLKQRKTVK